MYKICIADDEAYIVKSIEQRILQSGFVVEIAGCAANGAEALELYQEQKPDIFYVDVNMPGMSGLEFIEQVRLLDEESVTKFIVISGYDDFTYMKNAIQLGVVDYIMKPIQQQEFVECLRTVCGKIDGERVRQKELMKNRKKYWEDGLVELESFSGTVLLLYQDKLAVMLEELFQVNKKEWEAMFPKEVWNYYWFHESRNVCLLMGKDRFLEEPQIRELQDRCGSWIQPYIVWGEVHEKEIGEVLNKLERSLDLRFWHGFSQLIPMGEEKITGLEIDWEQLELIVENRKKEQGEKLLQNIFEKLFARKENLYSMRETHSFIIALFVGLYSKYQLQIPQELKQEFYQMVLANYKKKDEILELWIEYAAKCEDEIEKLFETDDVVEGVCRYLEQHYSEEISIADLSEEFFLAPNYIAKRFKEKKKVTILQYLENIRIGKAREYLKMTEYSVSEIAALVGYNDANYFTRAFRKVCDMSPREFRKQEHFE